MVMARAPHPAPLRTRLAAYAIVNVATVVAIAVKVYNIIAGWLGYELPSTSDVVGYIRECEAIGLGQSARWFVRVMNPPLWERVARVLEMGGEKVWRQGDQ
jgi:hypothetical protein